MAEKPEEELPRKSVACVKGETKAETCRNLAALACGADLAAFRVIHAVDGKGVLFTNMDIPILMKYLREQSAIVQGGGLAPAEAMLTNQAIALQSLFARLVELGMNQASMPVLKVI